MSLHKCFYTLIFGALVFATGCPENNDENNTPTNNQTNNTKKDMSGNDMSEDMPTVDMTGNAASTCTWLRTTPATLPLDGTPTDVNVMLGCDGDVTSDVSIKRARGEGGKYDGITCVDGDELGPPKTCTVLFKGVTAPDEGLATAAGAEVLSIILPGINDGTLSTTLRWHMSTAQINEQLKDIKTRQTPKGLGSKGLGMHLKALDKDNATFFGVHAHKILIEKDLEKQRQEILKNLEFEFGGITNTANEPAAPTVKTPNLGSGVLNYQNSALARTKTGFQALWWGQVNEGNTESASFAGVLFTLDTKGQPVGAETILKPVVQPEDPLKNIVSSQLYHLDELEPTDTDGYSAGVLHTTQSGKWMLTQLFYGDKQAESRSSDTLDLFGKVSVDQYENGIGWVGLMPRAIEEDPKDAKFYPLGWSAIPTALGVTFSLVDINGGDGAAQESAVLDIQFDVESFHVGLSDRRGIMILAVGKLGQQSLFTISTVGDKLGAPVKLDMPIMSDYTPSSIIPEDSIFANVAGQRDLAPIERDGGVSLSGKKSDLDELRRRRGGNLTRRLRNRYKMSMRSYWDPTGAQNQTATNVLGDKQADFAPGKVSSISKTNSNNWACQDECLEENGENNACGETPHFRPVASNGNGTIVGIQDGKTPTLGVQGGDGVFKPLPVASLNGLHNNWFAPSIVVLDGGEQMIAMPYKHKEGVSVQDADTLALWFVDNKGVVSQPALVSFGATIEHQTALIAGMGTEVLVFFGAPDGGGNLNSIPVAKLKTLTQDNKTVAQYDIQKNAIAIGALTEDGQDTQLFTQNAMNVPFGRKLKAGQELVFPPIDRFALVSAGASCGVVNAANIADPLKSMLLPLGLFNPSTDETCTDGDQWVARGDFLGTGGEQLVTFDGQKFALFYLTSSDFTIPEKVVMEKEDDFYSLSIDPTQTPINGIVAEDFNGDGLIDLAIDHGEGLVIAFSDGMGGTLASSGKVPGLSRLVDTQNNGIHARAAGFGSGTKKSTTTTQSSMPQLQ